MQKWQIAQKRSYIGSPSYLWFWGSRIITEFYVWPANERFCPHTATIVQGYGPTLEERRACVLRLIAQPGFMTVDESENDD